MRLVILTGSLAGTKFDVSPIGVAIGRRENCDLRFADADAVVSGLHARISWRDGAWILRDEGSSNGTLLDGQPVTETPLANGQIITFGQGGPTARVELPMPTARVELAPTAPVELPPPAAAAALPPPAAAAVLPPPAAQPVHQKAKPHSGLPSTSAKDALGAVSSLVLNPVGGLSPAYTALSPDRALGAGLALCVVFAIVSALGTAIGSGRMTMMFGMVGYGENSFGIFLRALIGFLVLPAAMIGASLGARKVLSGSGPLAADVFTIGAALTPLGLALLLSSFLGLANYELAMLLMLFAVTYLVLMLFTGLTQTRRADGEGGGTRGADRLRPLAVYLQGRVCGHDLRKASARTGFSRQQPSV